MMSSPAQAANNYSYNNYVDPSSSTFNPSMAVIIVVLVGA
jgi:hypothetical protein